MWVNLKKCNYGNRTNNNKFCNIDSVLLLFAYQMAKMKQKLYKVISTENHKAFFTTRKEAEKYIRHVKKQVSAFTEFRIYEVEK